MFRIAKPEPDEYAEYYGKYIQLVGEDAMATLRASNAVTARLLSGVAEPQACERPVLDRVAGQPIGARRTGRFVGVGAAREERRRPDGEAQRGRGTPVWSLSSSHERILHRQSNAAHPRRLSLFSQRQVAGRRGGRADGT